MTSIVLNIVCCYSFGMVPHLRTSKKLFIELISLSTPRARLWFWVIATCLIFLLPYKFFENVSLWQRIGWDSAPSIGLTRAYWLLIHGDVAGAWDRNRLLFLVLAIGMPMLLVDTFRIVRATFATTTPVDVRD